MSKDRISMHMDYSDQYRLGDASYTTSITSSAMKYTYAMVHSIPRGSVADLTRTRYEVRTFQSWLRAFLREIERSQVSFIS